MSRLIAGARRQRRIAAASRWRPGRQKALRDVRDPKLIKVTLAAGFGVSGTLGITREKIIPQQRQKLRKYLSVGRVILRRRGTRGDDRMPARQRGATRE